MTTRRAAILLGSVGIAAATAQAEINWTTQMQFRNRVGTVDQPPLVGNMMDVTATGAYTFTVQVGIFNMTGLSIGQANYGVATWTTSLAATGLLPGETLGVVQSSSRVVPFTFGPATNFGGDLVAPDGLNNVRAVRDRFGGASAVWPWDTQANQPGPMPTVPSNPSPGADSFVSVWRFQVVVSSLIAGDINVHFTGQAGPVVQWGIFGSTPPEEPGLPGLVNFIGLTPTPELRDYAPTTLTLIRVPAPGAAAALLLAPAVLAARRRPRPGTPTHESGTVTPSPRRPA